jgi:hypothetical protein
VRRHLLLATATVAFCLFMADRVNAADVPTRGVLLEPARLLDDLDGRPVGAVLPAHSIITVLARSETLYRSTRLDWLGAPRVLVRTADGRRGWLRGEDVAVSVTSPHTRNTLGFRHEPSSHPDEAGPKLWFAVSERQEWNEKEEWFDFAAVKGVLVTESPKSVHTLPIGRLSGWGSATELLRSTWRDMTGDGEPELLLSVDEYMTEVGYGGRMLQVVTWTDGVARLLHSEYAHNPNGNGLSQSIFGSLHVDGASIRIEGVTQIPGHCGEDTHGRRAACVDRWTKVVTWSKEQKAFVSHTETRPLQSTMGLDLDWYPSKALGEEPDRDRYGWVTW